jgi:RNA polymerase sigma-70 factor (ECF subfamily)
MPVSPESLHEQMLVIRSQIGDERAFRDLLELFSPRLLHFAQRMLQSSPDRVADVMQEIWIAIYRCLPRLNEVAKFRAWAFRIARDRIYLEYRRRKMPSMSLDAEEFAEMPDSTAVELSVDHEEMRRCLDAVSPPHREVLVLRFFEDMSYEDIAKVMSCSVGTVRSRIHYAKDAVKKVWEGNTL